MRLIIFFLTIFFLNFVLWVARYSVQSRWMPVHGTWLPIKILLFSPDHRWWSLKFINFVNLMYSSRINIFLLIPQVWFLLVSVLASLLSWLRIWLWPFHKWKPTNTFVADSKLTAWPKLSRAPWIFYERCYTQTNIYLLGGELPIWSPSLPDRSSWAGSDIMGLSINNQSFN